MTTVLFWDIDGTLLTTRRAGIFALEKAAREVVGTAVDLAELKTAGQIDPSIAKTIFQQYGIVAQPEQIEQLLQRYVEYLPASLLQTQGAVLQGVKEILVALKTRPDVLSLILTGNTEAGAKAKLSHYGLDTYFTGGAFSDRATDRNAIARQALMLAQQTLGEAIHPEKLYVIGDTPDDIYCGKAIGARAIALASGSYSVTELEQHQPWLTLPYLPEPKIFLAKIGINVGDES